jgi:hypothetical protein
VDLYRDGRQQRVGTFWTQREAIAAYEKALARENPDLHAAPERVDRSELP